MDISREQALALWAASDGARNTMRKRADYYEGSHDILKKSGPDAEYADGTPKSKVVTNWIAYVVNRYLGAISQIQVSLQDSDNQEALQPALDEYRNIVEDQNLEATDNTNILNALCQSYGVEVHSFDAKSKRIIINSYEPREWLFVYDSSGDTQAAIRSVTLQKNTAHEGEFLADDYTVLTVYTATEITEHMKAKGSSEWMAPRVTRHFYGRVPVIEWWTGGSVVSAALITQNDEYNEVDSMAGDAIEREIDSLLITKGISPEWLRENIQLVKELRVLPLDETGDAKILARTADGQRFVDTLKRTRGQIHMMGEVPDVGGIVGASGATSGIALKLMFTPMQERVEAMIPHLRQCVKERIELMNAIWKRTGGVLLDDYEITIQFRMPVNHIEEWQNIGALDGTVSHRTRLNLLTDITDAEAELQNIENERGVAPLRGEPADAAAAINERAAQVEANAAALVPSVGELVASLSDAVTEYMIKSGALEKEMKAASN